MAGTVAGGRAARDSNYAKYGRDFYKRIGAMGGKKGRTGGFHANRELARIAGAKGGRISRRQPAVGSRRWYEKKAEAQNARTTTSV